jgi:hypothetical protein
MPIVYCASPKKNGQLCNGVGLFPHPEFSGLVCDAHRPGGPGSETLKRGRRLAYQAAIEAEQHRQEVFPRYVSEKSLQALLTALRQLREGQPLPRKIQRLMSS